MKIDDRDSSVDETPSAAQVTTKNNKKGRVKE